MSKKLDDFLAKAEDLIKRSKNVRRELARINAGKKGEEKTIAREEKYARDKAGISNVKQSPNIGTIAETKTGDRKNTAAVTDKDKADAGWKKNKNGKHIHKPVISANKDGTSNLTHIGTPKSIRHETAHVVRADDSIVDLDHKMQVGYGKVKSIGAATAKASANAAKQAGGNATDIAAAKKQGDKAGNPHAHQGEYETNGVENAVARRTGSLPPRNTVSREGGGAKDATDALQVGMSGAKKDKPIHKLVPEHTSKESSVVRRDRQAKQKSSAKKQGKDYVKPSSQTANMVHIASLSENVRPEIKTKVEQKLDTAEIKHNPINGGKPEKSNTVDAKINGRSAGRRDIKDDVKSKQATPISSKKKKFKFVKPGEKGERLAASEAGKEVKSLLKSLIDKVNAKKD